MMNTPKTLKGTVVTVQSEGETALRLAVVSTRWFDQFSMCRSVPALRGLINALDAQQCAYEILCEYPAIPPRPRQAVAKWLVRKHQCQTSIQAR